MKKIMFIGAGPYQLKGIEKAKSMGLFVIATDINSQAVGFKTADLSYTVDVRDSKECLKIAKENSIDAVLAVASEASIQTVAYISQHLGLPGINTAVAETVTDKELMRQAFYKHSVPSPRSYAVYNFEQLLEKINELGLPVVVKPADNAGSRGVRFVREKREFKEAYRNALGYSKKEKVLVEEFMDGVEVSVEAFMDNGVANIIALSDKVRTPAPFFLDTEVIFPSAYSDNTKAQIIDVAKKAIKAVGIGTGPVHMELMMTKEGPVPVELAARGPGFKVFTDIIPMITGIDILKAQIDVSLGRKPYLKHMRHFASVIKFFEAHDGIVKEISGIDEIRSIDGVYEIELYVDIGDKVRDLTCGSDRIGHIISLSQTREKAIDIIRKSEKRLQVKIS